MGLLSIRNLAVSIATIAVCRDLSLDIAAGSCWAILGRNGIGKSTLLKTLAGLHTPDAGSIAMDGSVLDRLPRRQRARLIGIQLQEQSTLFSGTVLETALIGRHPWLGGMGWEGPDDVALAQEALASVGLEDFGQRSLATLSGGELQRLAIATLLVQQPTLCLLDEPTNHLDPGHQIRIMELLKRRAGSDGRALIMVLHDVNLAARYCDHALLLYGDGEADAGGTRAVLTAGNLERLYGHPMTAVETACGEFFYPA